MAAGTGRGDPAAAGGAGLIAARLDTLTAERKRLLQDAAVVGEVLGLHLQRVWKAEIQQRVDQHEAQRVAVRVSPELGVAEPVDRLEPSAVAEVKTRYRVDVSGR